jgi:hypothetical protein
MSRSKRPRRNGTRRAKLNGKDPNGHWARRKGARKEQASSRPGAPSGRSGKQTNKAGTSKTQIGKEVSDGATLSSVQTGKEQTLGATLSSAQTGKEQTLGVGRTHLGQETAMTKARDSKRERESMTVQQQLSALQTLLGPMRHSTGPKTAATISSTEKKSWNR